MFRLEMLAACEGDCLILSWGDETCPHRLLVDGGRRSTAAAIMEYVDKVGREFDMFELFIVTHIDRDHIEGAVTLLEDESFRPLVKEVWFNDRGDLDYAEPALGFETYGAFDGERLSKLISENEMKKNSAFHPAPVAVHNEKLPVIALAGGLTLTVLSPDQGQLADLAKPWDEIVEDARDGWETFGKSGPINIDSLARQQFKGDRAKPNASSIAVIAEFDGRKVLLGADAHIARLLTSLDVYKAECEEHRGFSLVKAMHHGSKGNISNEFVVAVNCSHWAISTNGAHFKHPDREAIARIIASSPAPVNVYFNYDSDFTNIWRGILAQDYDLRVHYGTDGYISIDVPYLS